MFLFVSHSRLIEHDRYCILLSILAKVDLDIELAFFPKLVAFLIFQPVYALRHDLEIEIPKHS